MSHMRLVNKAMLPFPPPHIHTVDVHSSNVFVFTVLTITSSILKVSSFWPLRSLTVEYEQTRENSKSSILSASLSADSSVKESSTKRSCMKNEAERSPTSTDNFVQFRMKGSQPARQFCPILPVYRAHAVSAREDGIT